MSLHGKRYSDLRLNLFDTLSEQDLITLREGDRLAVVVEFKGWLGYHPNTHVGSRMMKIEIKPIEASDYALTIQPQEYTVFAAQVKSVHTAEIDLNDVVLVTVPAHGLNEIGRVMAIDGDQAFVRWIFRPGNAMVEIASCKRHSLDYRSLTADQKKLLDGANRYDQLPGWDK